MNWTNCSSSFPAFQGVWPGIRATAPQAPWQGGLFSRLATFVEEGGAGLGIAVGHQPLNKAANAKLPALWFPGLWVRPRGSTRERGRLRHSEVAWWAIGRGQPFKPSVLSTLQAFKVKPGQCWAQGTGMNPQTSGQAFTCLCLMFTVTAETGASRAQGEDWGGSSQRRLPGGQPEGAKAQGPHWARGQCQVCLPCPHVATAALRKE